MKADEGPKAFLISGAVNPKLWVALYKGRVSPPEITPYLPNELVRRAGVVKAEKK